PEPHCRWWQLRSCSQSVQVSAGRRAGLRHCPPPPEFAAVLAALPCPASEERERSPWARCPPPAVAPPPLLSAGQAHACSAAQGHRRLSCAKAPSGPV